MTAPADTRISDERLDEIEATIDRLRSFARAYPETAFPPVTDEEREWIKSERRGLLDRISADMGRHFAQFATEAADALTELRERRAQAVTVKPPFDSTLADACLAMAKDIFARYFQKPGASEAERAGLATYLYKCATTGALAEYAAAPPPAQSADAAKEPQAVAVAWLNPDNGAISKVATRNNTVPLYAAPPAPASGGVSEDDEEAFPTLREAYASALAAAELFYDAASVDEANWSGWGDQIIPPYAEMRRVKAKQALLALRDADPKMRAAITQPAGKE